MANDSTNKPVASGSEDASEESQVRLVKIRLEDGTIVSQPLPPINRIKIPNTQTKSATIRWLGTLGYSVSDISNQLGVRYQMVRNILTNIPKRAAREDLPEIVVEYLPEPDELQAAMDGALELGLMEQRQVRKKAEKAMRRAEGLED